MEAAAGGKRRRKKKGASAAALSQVDAERSLEGKIGIQSGSDDGETYDHERTLNLLVEAFSSYSLERVKSAYQEAEGDPVRAAEILVSSSAESTVCGGSNGQPSTVNRSAGKRKQKKVVASTGLVANVISKDYGCSFAAEKGEKNACFRSKTPCNLSQIQVEAEEFLCSMLGGSCDLDPAVVKDVFGHSGYDLEKALDILLDMCGSPNEKSTQNIFDDYSQPLYEHIGFECDQSRRDCLKKCSSSEEKRTDLEQDVLASLFNVPNTFKQEASSLNWRKALKNVENFSHASEFPPTSASEPSKDLREGSLRSAAGQQWTMMKSYYQQAAVAYAKGDRAHASYLSEKGKFCRKLAQAADEKASQEIFEARNKEIKNAVTIDLHGQHVKQAIRLLKVHLLLLTYVPSIKFLRVITGCGKGRLKQSAADLLSKEGIAWREENPGTLILGIDRSKKYSFMDADSDDESD